MFFDDYLCILSLSSSSHPFCSFVVHGILGSLLVFPLSFILPILCYLCSENPNGFILSRCGIVGGEGAKGGLMPELWELGK